MTTPNLFGFASEEMKKKHEQTQQLKEVSFLQDAAGRFLKSKFAVVGCVIILFIMSMSIFAPMRLFSSHRYDLGIIEHQSIPPRFPGIEKLGILNGEKNGRNLYVEKNIPDEYYLFGTDTLGRDIWARVWTGTRVSLYMAFLAVFVDMIIGMTYGIVSGYFGGKLDMILQRIIEVLNSIPDLVIVTLLVFVLTPGILSITLAIVIKGWIGMSRISRAQVLRLKEQEFILASHTLGSSNKKIMIRDILPNIFGQVIVMSMFSIPNAIFTESFLAFIGLGLQPPMASLGVLINEGFKSFLVSPYMVIIPTTILAILMLSFTVVADGLRDAFDPKMKEV